MIQSPNHKSQMQPVILARNAMATRFELVLHGNDAAALRAAGEEALDEIGRLEEQLSLYRPGSEIAQINSRAARESVRLSPEVFALLEKAERISQETGGAFDITVAPLVRCWGFMGAFDHETKLPLTRPSAPLSPIGGEGRGEGARRFKERENDLTRRIPSAAEVAAARAVVGMNLVQLDARERTVRFAREGVMLDLGAIGKGYAIERAADLLREAGVTSALIHGGTSTTCAIGSPPGAECWTIAVNLGQRVHASAWCSDKLKLELQLTAFSSGTPPTPITIPLRDEALSVSAVWGRSFEADGKSFGHVLDPRTGQPVSGALLAVVVLPSATETDALSTALLTLGEAGFETISNLRPGTRTLLVVSEDNELHVKTLGIGS
jgi:thiamine biosynthesis lipoprotein